MKTWILAVLCAVGLVAIGGLLGAVFSTEGYGDREQPSFAPPSWVFGPVWTALYAMIGISLALLIKQRATNALYWFGAQLFLNFLWTPAFFGIDSPLVAFIIILALLATLVVTMFKAWNYSRIAVYLLVPYVLWVAFATVLNGAHVF